MWGLYRRGPYTVQIPTAYTEQYSRNLRCVPPRQPWWRRLLRFFR